MDLLNAQRPSATGNQTGFVRAHERARRFKTEGSIRSFRVDACPLRGRVIALECDSGWSPYPLFVERPTPIGLPN